MVGAISDKAEVFRGSGSLLCMYVCMSEEMYERYVLRRTVMMFQSIRSQVRGEKFQTGQWAVPGIVAAECNKAS